MEYKASLEDFIKFKSKLTRYALNLTKTQSDLLGHYIYHKDKADDLVSDTYLKYHLYFAANPDYFNSEDHLYSFLKMVIYKLNLTRFDLRTLDTQQRTSTSYLETVLLEGEDNASYTLARNGYTESNLGEYGLFVEEVNKVIDRLTGNQLFVYDKLLKGYKMIEIAKELNVSKQAVDCTIRTIRVKINNILKGEESNKRGAKKGVKRGKYAKE
jgi:DNA-directed RNA polymerase specialized sigma24 family protein